MEELAKQINDQAEFGEDSVVIPNKLYNKLIDLLNTLIAYQERL